MAFILLRVFLALAASTFASGSQCFLKGGFKPDSGTNFQPCFPSDAQTHCCDSGQTCLSNGLCLVQWDSSLNTGACTDSSWGSSSCFQECDQFATLYRCNDNKWCCSNGGNTTSCCNDPNLNSIEISQVALIQNGSAFIGDYTISPVAKLATTTSTSTACTATVLAAIEKSNSKTFAAGIGAGLGVGLPLLVIIGTLSFLLMRNKARVKALQQRLDSADTQNFAHPDDKGMVITGVSEVYGKPRSELPPMEKKRPSELQ